MPDQYCGRWCAVAEHATIGFMRRASLISLGAVAGVLAFLLAPAGASAAVPWGFNEDWGWSNGTFNSAETAKLHMQKAGAIMPDSISANRFHVEWSYVQGVRGGTYNWSMSDAQYAAMQKYTKKPIMLLYRAPVWARDPARTCAGGGDEYCIYPPLPEFDGDWKAFVQAAVTRYPNVRAIEVWNEPNIATFWSPAADPTRYAALLKTAHDAVRAAGSKAPVLTGGLYPANTTGGNVSAKDFLSRVYATAGASVFEGIGTHPYVHQEVYVDRMRTRLDALRAVRDQYGDSATPLWITEAGISSDSTSGVGLDRQADVLADLYRSLQGQPDVRSFVIHRLYDVGSDYWGEYGVLYPDLTPKPAYCKLGALIGTACR